MTDERLDTLRDELRARGYLDARVDRFVLGGAMKKASPFGVALAASIRIGLLAGVLLGPAAAIGLRLRAPELVTSVGDALVVSAYLAVLFAIAAGVVAMAGVLLGAAAVRWSGRTGDLSRRARRAATAAGMGVGLACLAYLTLWWRTATGLAGSSSLTSSLAVIAVAVAISILLGHAVAITVLACLARLGLAPDLSRRVPMSSWKTTLPLGGVALAGAVALLVATGPGSPTPELVPRLTVVPTGVRAVVLAVDGIDPTTLDRLRGAGRLPAFDRLLNRSMATVPSDTDRDPARVWTTIATGQPPERHGIRALESRQVAGLEGRLRGGTTGWALLTAATDLLRLTQPTIASGNERLIPAFWEVVARAGLRTAVVHWWATWPANELSGIVLSDRAILRLERGGPLDAEIAPAGLYDDLRPVWAERRSHATALAGRLVTADVTAETATALRRSAELDATIATLAASPALADADLVVVYLPGLDIVQSALFGAAGSGLAPSAAAERVTALERYYVFLDGLVGDLLSGRAAEARLDVLVTQPGRAGGKTDGRLAVSGSAGSLARFGTVATAVAPTILHALGLPLALDLASAPALELFDTSFAARHPVRHVSTYGTRRALARPSGGQPLDREMIERMRSLGYVR